MSRSRWFLVVAVIAAFAVAFFRPRPGPRYPRAVPAGPAFDAAEPEGPGKEAPASAQTRGASRTDALVVDSVPDQTARNHKKIVVPPPARR